MGDLMLWDGLIKVCNDAPEHYRRRRMSNDVVTLRWMDSHESFYHD